jgi:hypothetical protein
MSGCYKLLCRKKEEAIDRIEKVQRQNILTLRAVAILIKSFALKK